MENTQETSRLQENPFFEIKALGNFEHEKVKINQNPIKEHPESLKNVIDEIWQETNQKRQEKGLKLLTDTPQLKLENLTTKNGILTMEVTLSSYKDHIAWQNKEFRNKFPEFKPNITGTNIVVRTSDNKLMIVQRSLESATKPGAMSVAGGQWDITKDCDENGVWDPFKTISRELEEESGIKREELQDLELKGVIFNKNANNPSVVFFADTSLSSEEIKKRPTDKEADVKFINDVQDEIEHSILWWASSPSPSGSSALAIYGRQRFGNDWLNKIVTRINTRDSRLYSKLTPEQLDSINQKASKALSRKD